MVKVVNYASHAFQNCSSVISCSELLTFLFSSHLVEYENSEYLMITSRDSNADTTLHNLVKANKT